MWLGPALISSAGAGCPLLTLSKSAGSPPAMQSPLTCSQTTEQASLPSPLLGSCPFPLGFLRKGLLRRNVLMGHQPRGSPRPPDAKLHPCLQPQDIVPHFPVGHLSPGQSHDLGDSDLSLQPPALSPLSCLHSHLPKLPLLPLNCHQPPSRLR